MDRTQEEFRQSSAAALSRAVIERAPVSDVRHDDTTVDEAVAIEAVPAINNIRYRERTRFNS